VYAPEKPPNLSRVKRVAGDYDESELESLMMRPATVGDLVQTWLDLSQLHPTVVFAVSVEHSLAIQARFTEAGIRCGHIDATTDPKDRVQALVDLEVGKLQVLSNVGILCEGWDQPRVKCCIMARPTLSLTLWMQCAGRILRPWEGVKPILLDHAGNVERHGMPHEDRAWSLDGKVTRLAPAVRCLVCKRCYAYIDRQPCEHCGHHEAVDRKPPPEKPGKLVPVSPVDPKRAFYEKQVNSARNRGFKPGYAAAKYKEKFDGWPPWAWSQETKTAFESDPEWQQNLREHQERKAEYEAKAAERLARIEGVQGYTLEPEEA
jgi:superfamily II DNA or RNA helicase